MTINWNNAPDWAEYAAVDRHGNQFWVAKPTLSVKKSASFEDEVENDFNKAPNSAIVVDARKDYTRGHHKYSKRGAIAKYLKAMRQGDKIRVAKIIDKNGEEKNRRLDRVLIHIVAADHGYGSFSVIYDNDDLIVSCLCS